MYIEIGEKGGRIVVKFAINNTFIYWVRRFLLFVRADTMILFFFFFFLLSFFLSSGIFYEKLIRTRVLGIREHPLPGLNPDPGMSFQLCLSIFGELLFGDGSENAEFSGTGLTFSLLVDQNRSTNRAFRLLCV